jgi:hypothetical protein
MPIPPIIDIAPGYGNAGVAQARDALAKKCRDAVVTALGPGYDLKVSVVDSRDEAPRVILRFDDHTSLYIDLWPYGPGGGFFPHWHMATSRGGSLLEQAPLEKRPLRWDSEVEEAVRAVQRAIVDIKLVP